MSAPTGQGEQRAVRAGAVAEANTALPNQAISVPVGEAPAVDRLHAGELAISRLLRGGVTLAASLLVLSLVGSWNAGGSIAGTTVPFAELFAGERTAPAILAQLGLLALALTPFARVALAAGLFARAGEKRQALVSAAVLALLLVALFLGAAEG